MNAGDAIRRLREVVRRQHKAISTEATYVFWLRRYMLAIPRHPEELNSEQKLERFLTELARDRGVSAVSQNQAFNSILFSYRDVLGQPLQNVDVLRATRPVRMRTAPSLEHTQALLRTIRNVGGYPTNLIARLFYGCGLRVSESLNLRIKDVDLRRCRLCIPGAKGGKDRVAVLPSPASLFVRRVQSRSYLVSSRLSTFFSAAFGLPPPVIARSGVENGLSGGGVLTVSPTISASTLPSVTAAWSAPEG